MDLFAEFVATYFNYMCGVWNRSLHKGDPLPDIGDKPLLPSAFSPKYRLIDGKRGKENRVE